MTDSKEMYKRLKLIRSHGRLETADYFSSTEYMDYVTLGYNFRMSNITAALGLAQLKKTERIIKKRRKRAQFMSDKLSQIKEVVTPSPSDASYHVYQMYTIRVKNGLRDSLMHHLAEKGIMTKVYFSPVHLTHFYSKSLKYRCSLPVTEEMSEQVLTLPMYPSLSQQEIVYITEEIGYFFKEAKS